MKTADIIKEISRKLRKNMTESEVILGSFIKGYNNVIKNIKRHL